MTPEFFSKNGEPWKGKLALYVTHPNEEEKLLRTAEGGSHEEQISYLSRQQNDWVRNQPDRYVNASFRIGPERFL